MNGDQSSSWPFSYCPRCASVEIELVKGHKYRCRACGMTYYHNVASGSGVLIMNAGKLLLLRRGKEPGKGLFTIPGGFVDPGESAEEAVVRECREEVGIEIDRGALRYLTSAPNFYRFRDVPYVTCDIFFFAFLDSCSPELDEDEATEILFTAPGELDPAILAFPSTKHAVSELNKRLESGL